MSKVPEWVIGMFGVIGLLAAWFALISVVFSLLTAEYKDFKEEIKCSPSHELIEPAPRLTKQEDSYLYRCSNDKQWWEEGCERYFTDEEKSYE